MIESSMWRSQFSKCPSMALIHKDSVCCNAKWSTKMHLDHCFAKSFTMRRVLPPFLPQPLQKSRCELYACEMAQERSEETAEQHDSAMLRLTSTQSGARNVEKSQQKTSTEWCFDAPLVTISANRSVVRTYPSTEYLCRINSGKTL